MPIGPGGLDSNGIWQFGEDDSEALASDLLNLGMASVSTAIGGLGGAGILQVVSTTKTDTFSASVSGGGLSSEITGLTASITPSSASSKILVMMGLDGASSYGNGQLAFQLLRDGSAIAIGDSAGSRTRLTAQDNNFGSDNSDTGSASKTFLDSPASTSSVTYSFKLFNSTGSTSTLYLNRSSGDSNLTTRGRSVSTITLMEVAG